MKLKFRSSSSQSQSQSQDYSNSDQEIPSRGIFKSMKKKNKKTQSHWSVKQPNLIPQPILKTHITPAKLDLPFVEGHIGSRFSINTLIKSIKPVNLTPDDLKNRQGHSKSASDDLSDLHPKIKGPYQPRSVLSRTRSAYGLKPRKKSKNSDGEFDDEESNDNPGSTQSNKHLSSLEQYERQFHPTAYQAVIDKHKSAHLGTVREEDTEELAQSLNIDEDYETWVLKALDPIPHSTSFANSTLSNSQIGSLPIKVTPTPTLNSIPRPIKNETLQNIYPNHHNLNPNLNANHLAIPTRNQTFTPIPQSQSQFQSTSQSNYQTNNLTSNQFRPNQNPAVSTHPTIVLSHPPWSRTRYHKPMPPIHQKIQSSSSTKSNSKSNKTNLKSSSVKKPFNKKQPDLNMIKNDLSKLNLMSCNHQNLEMYEKPRNPPPIPNSNSRKMFH
ncbi:hypothetical protein DFH28DRAFT_960788 [Melampsora americana]|nr:hypothetical protein DFH28DRAFT_960788 [Melampsora americana]